MHHRSARFSLALLLGGCSAFGGTDETREKLSEFLLRARTYHEAGRQRQALDQVERGLELDPKDEKLRALKGFIYLQLAREDVTYLEDALPLFEELGAASLFRSPPLEARLGLGMALQGLAQKDMAYAAQLERALQEGKVAPDKVAAAEKAVPEARARGTRELERAAEAYAWVLERQPDHILALYHQGLAHSSLGRSAEALDLLRAYIQVASRRRQAILDRELKMTLDKEREDQLWRNIRTLEAREKECRGLAANLLYKAGDYAGALAELDALLKMDPNLVHEFFNRARCHARLGNRGAAMEDFRRFVGGSLLPREDPRVREALEFLGEPGA